LHPFVPESDRKDACRRQGCTQAVAVDAFSGKLHETANNIYAVVSGAVRITIDGHQDELPGLAGVDFTNFTTTNAWVIA
jgi:hypothetical protein